MIVLMVLAGCAANTLLIHVLLKTIIGDEYIGDEIHRRRTILCTNIVYNTRLYHYHYEHLKGSGGRQ